MSSKPKRRVLEEEHEANVQMVFQHADADLKKVVALLAKAYNLPVESMTFVQVCLDMVKTEANAQVTREQADRFVEAVTELLKIMVADKMDSVYVDWSN